MDNKKLLTWGAVIVGGYIVYKSIQSYNKKKLQSGYPYSPDPDGEIITTTFNANKIANQIFEAMENYGTDWNTIVSSINKVKSDADFDALVSAFGTRTVNCGSFNPFCSDFTGDLADCLKDELDSSELEEVNAILQKNGVTKTI